MKKFGGFVIIVLLLLVVWHSGLLDDERLISGVETGIRTVLGMLEEATRFVIGKFK